MKLNEKIIMLRKKEGLSQEALAEKLMLSRQAVSRWESGSSLPDALNILQLSKLFSVSADYLLNDEIEEAVPPLPREREQGKKIMFLALVLTLIGLVFAAGSFFFALAHPWIYNGIDGLLGSFLGTNTLIPFILGLAVMMIGLAFLLWEAFRKRN